MAEWMRDTPWRQGNLLPSNAMAVLGLSSPDSSSEVVAIVATHDCDLAQDPQGEPDVELIVGAKITQLDGNHTHAKNARKLHIVFSGEMEIFAEFVVTNKVKLSKSSLAQYHPDSGFCLNTENKSIFQRWLASRYRRSAFPDEFEKRLKGVTGLADKIAKAVKPCGESITAIFFDVDGGEELIRSGPTDVYVLDVYILYGDLPTSEIAESLAFEVKEKIETAFNEKAIDQINGHWKYIELRYIDVISEHSLTYYQSKHLKQWRLEHISLAADPQQSLLPE